MGDDLVERGLQLIGAVLRRYVEVHIPDTSPDAPAASPPQGWVERDSVTHRKRRIDKPTRRSGVVSTC
jgi:hypothetical protein